MSPLHPLVTKAQKSLPVKTSALEKDFFAHFYARTSGDDLNTLDIITLQRTARQHWDMARTRKDDECMIRVHSPAIDKDGWPLHRTVIDFVDNDMAFQIDSIAAELTRAGHVVHLMVHPVLHIKRNASGGITAISQTPINGSQPQSHIHIQLSRLLTPAECAELQANLARIAQEVRYATSDWQAIRAKLRQCEELMGNAPSSYPQDAIAEYKDFLEYMHNDNFTLLGYREYAYKKDKDGKMVAKAVKNSHLGLLRHEVKTEFMPEGYEALPPNLARFSRDKVPMRVFKLHRKSTVHRRVPLDAVLVRLFDEKGAVSGEAIFIGLFTSVTYSRSIRDIPYLGRKANLVIERSGFAPGTHGHKALSHILEKYPRDEMLQMDVDTIHDYTTSIMRLQERQRIALYTRVDAFEKNISCLVYVPRDRYDTQLRMKIQKILEDTLNGVSKDFYTTLDDSPLARVMFSIALNKGTVPKFDREALEASLQDAGRAWPEQIEEAFRNKMDNDAEIARLSAEYGNAFPVAYRDMYGAKQCVHDIFQVENVKLTNDLARDLYRPSGKDGHQLHLKLFRPGQPVVLSDVLPILENMGLRVISEIPFEIKPANGDTVWIHDFELEVPEAKGKDPINVNDINVDFEDSFIRIWHGRSENDSLNRLTLSAAMTWQDILVLRSYVRYMRQGQSAYSIPYIEKALTDYPAIARMIVNLFHVRLDPAYSRKKSAPQAEIILADIEDALNSVTALDQDRILRSMVNMVESTLRTNFFQRDEDGSERPSLSLKLDSAQINDLPHPRPFREIWVYSPRMEGVHLRGDRIARGGIRWSDRNEDFRTEVLGLLKAQQVKNAVIVPMGAKGGFVLKRPPVDGGRPAFQAEGIECYKLLVRGMLDITDNRIGKKIVPPKDVVRRDGDDPYLVVAADKGTATFSDIANGLSAEYGFWLGDAFASGGSVGYDHKKMGITARGAWESVKRHFRELGTDIQTTAFDVIGVGDMAGDVFGNGMLLSKHIRLVGAFNHVHIVCDPNPTDIDRNFKERDRLFKEVKGWDQYDTSLLSKGGRIFNRSEKSLALTPEIRERFGIDRDKVTPAELMNAMLRAQTDLLWFGGIGTYIKSTAETHADVGDKANDSIRITAPEIRARVVGEGANLGCTQKARIEYAKLGGRVNADFIDNSGGVNSSDVEVNIKILMTDVVNNPTNKMDVKKRNTLLASMTGEVAALVLRNSYQQVQGISLMTMQAPKTLVGDAILLRKLEKEQGLSRKLENLPDAIEIEQRRLAGQGLVRPELCILQSYAKIAYTRELLNSDIPSMPEMKDFLLTYFPKPLQDKFAKDIVGHQLGREIIAMSVANTIVNRMGATFIQSRMDATGAECADVVKAFMIVREAFNLGALWDAIEAQDGKVDAMVQLQAMLDIRDMAARAITWVLTRMGRATKLSTDIAAFRKDVERLRPNLIASLPPALAAVVETAYQAALQNKVPQGIARDLSLLPVLDSAFDIIRVAADCKADLAVAASTYFAVGETFHIEWLRAGAENLPASDAWSQEARNGMIDQLYTLQSALTVKILKDRLSVADWVEANKADADHVRSLLDGIAVEGVLDLPRLLIATQRLQNLSA